MRSGANAERSGDLDKARAEYLAAAKMGQSGAAAKAEEMRAKLVQRHTSNARSCLSRQNLDCSIENWQRVVALDPSNTSARRDLDKVLELDDKLKKIKNK